MGPDFLCVGLQKGGTRWLYDQLSQAGGVWMPPIKEINYFHKRSFKPGNMKKLELARERKYDWSDKGHYFLNRKFYEKFESGLVPENFNDDWYFSLFAYKGSRISGDISPDYATLNDKGVARVAELLPDVPVILLLRHPVDRVKSALSMSIRKNKIAEEDIQSPEKLNRILLTKEYASRSYPSRIWPRWVKYYWTDRRKYFFIEDIRLQPEKVRSQIADFINLRKPRFRLPADFNLKINDKKYAISSESEDFLYEFFHDEILRCRELFKGHALEWKTQL